MKRMATDHQATAAHVRGCRLCQQLDQLVGMMDREARAFEGGRRGWGMLEVGPANVGGHRSAGGVPPRGRRSTGARNIPGGIPRRGRPGSPPSALPDVQQLELGA